MNLFYAGDVMSYPLNTCGRLRVSEYNGHAPFQTSPCEISREQSIVEFGKHKKQKATRLIQTLSLLISLFAYFAENMNRLVN